jgi:hypothetical protein
MCRTELPAIGAGQVVLAQQINGFLNSRRHDRRIQGSPLKHSIEAQWAARMLQLQTDRSKSACVVAATARTKSKSWPSQLG